MRSFPELTLSCVLLTFPSSLLRPANLPRRGSGAPSPVLPNLLNVGLNPPSHLLTCQWWHMHPHGSSPPAKLTSLTPLLDTKTMMPWKSTSCQWKSTSKSTMKRSMVCWGKFGWKLWLFQRHYFKIYHSTFKSWGIWSFNICSFHSSQIQEQWCLSVQFAAGTIPQTKAVRATGSSNIYKLLRQWRRTCACGRHLWCWSLSSSVWCWHFWRTEPCTAD